VTALPTAPLAAGSLIAGYAVAAGTGSRPLGGLVLAAGGLASIELWRRRRGPATAAALGGAGLCAFGLSHAIAPLLGAWPAVLVVSGAMAALAWAAADAPARGERVALRRPAR
jgi:hypothetical protein